MSEVLNPVVLFGRPLTKGLRARPYIRGLTPFEPSYPRPTRSGNLAWFLAIRSRFVNCQRSFAAARAIALFIAVHCGLVPRRQAHFRRCFQLHSFIIQAAAAKLAFPRQHRLNFEPLPQGQGSLRPTFGAVRTVWLGRLCALLCTISGFGAAGEGPTLVALVAFVFGAGLCALLCTISGTFWGWLITSGLGGGGVDALSMMYLAALRRALSEASELVRIAWMAAKESVT